MQHSIAVRQSETKRRSSRERAIERHQMFEWRMRLYREWRKPRDSDVATKPREPIAWDVSVGTSTGQVFGPLLDGPPARAIRVRICTATRRPRSRRSHRVVRGVAKTTGGDSGDPEPETPTTRRTATTIGGAP